MRISTNEFIIVLLIVLIIFGPRQIPKLVRMCKRGVGKLKSKLDDDDEETETGGV